MSAPKHTKGSWNPYGGHGGGSKSGSHSGSGSGGHGGGSSY